MKTAEQKENNENRLPEGDELLEDHTFEIVVTPEEKEIVKGLEELW